MKTFLEKNNDILLWLYKFLDDEGLFDDLKELGELEEIDFDSVNVIGYKYDNKKDFITAYVLYADECSENGIGYDEFTFRYNDFDKFIKDNGYEI